MIDMRRKPIMVIGNPCSYNKQGGPPSYHRHLSLPPLVTTLHVSADSCSRVSDVTQNKTDNRDKLGRPEWPRVDGEGMLMDMDMDMRMLMDM